MITTQQFRWNPNYGSDMDGEYHRTSGATAMLNRVDHDLNHNYYITLVENYKKPKKVFIHLALTSSNNSAITLHSAEYKTLKEARIGTVEAINNLDPQPEINERIQNWMRHRIEPVFSYNNDEIKLIGDSYSSVGCEYNVTQRIKQLYQYYNPTPVNYTFGHFLRLSKYDEKIYISKEYISSGCTGGGSIDDKELASELKSRCLELIKDNPKYGKFFTEVQA